MFRSDGSTTITLELDPMTTAGLTAIVDLAMREGNPMEKLVAHTIGDTLRDAVLAAMPREQALSEMDEAIEQFERDGEAESAEKVREIRKEYLARDAITEEEAESPDVDGAIDEILRDTNGPQL